MRKLLKKGVNLKPVSLAHDKGFLRLLDQPVSLDDPACPDGWVNFYRVDDYSATALFYLDRPSSDLPALVGVAERLVE